MSMKVNMDLMVYLPTLYLLDFFYEKRNKIPVSACVDALLDLFLETVFTPNFINKATDAQASTERERKKTDGATTHQAQDKKRRKTQRGGAKLPLRRCQGSR